MPKFLITYHGALEMPPRTGPLDEQTLILAGHGAFGSMGTYGGEPQECIKRETA